MIYTPYKMTISMPKEVFSYDKPTIDQIDTWLNQVFLCDVVYDNNKEEDKKYFIKRVLKLSVCLLQGINIPIFSEGKIYSIYHNKDNDNYDITISLHYIEYIATKIYNSVVRTSIEIISRIFIYNISKNNLKKLHDIVEEQIYFPYKHFSGSSKSTLPILKTAFTLNIPYRRLVSGIYQLGWCKNSLWLSGSSISSDSKIGAQIVGNKMLTAILLKDVGLPHPIHKLVHKKDECIPAAKRLGYPLVVKPTDENGGRGVLLNIDNDEKLLIAFDQCLLFSKSGQILLEKQVKGICHRIFIVKQKLLYVIKRWPKSIQGNGKNTVKELISKLNSENIILPLWLQVEPYPLDDESKEVISSYGYTEDTILKKDEWLPLRYTESGQFGGRNEDVTKLIHPDNIEIALRAASLFGMEVAGIDLISEDISKPWYENNAIMNEVNFSPQLGRDTLSRKYIPNYLQNTINNKGRIPITVIIGKEKALDKAIALQKEKRKTNTTTFVCSNDKILNSAGKSIHYKSKTLNDRVKSLFLCKDIEELIIVVQNDDVLLTGIELDKIDYLSFIDDDVGSFNIKTLQFFKNLVKE